MDGHVHERPVRLWKNNYELLLSKILFIVQKLLSELVSCLLIHCSFGDFPSKSKLIISSDKLVKEGFSFKYGIEEIYDESVEYFKAKGLLQN